MKGYVHPTLSEILQMNNFNHRMNILDEKRRKKVSHSLETLKTSLPKEILLDEESLYESVQQFSKIARALKQLAKDVNQFFCKIELKTELF